MATEYLAILVYKSVVLRNFLVVFQKYNALFFRSHGGIVTMATWAWMTGRALVPRIANISRVSTTYLPHAVVLPCAAARRWRRARRSRDADASPRNRPAVSPVSGSRGRHRLDYGTSRHSRG